MCISLKKKKRLVVALELKPVYLVLTLHIPYYITGSSRLI